MNPRGEQPLSRHLALFAGGKERLDLERKVLAAAFRSSFEQGDTNGAALAHKGLCAILQTQLSEGDSTSTGSLTAQSKSATAVELAGQAAGSAEPVPTDADEGVGRKSYVSGTHKALSVVELEGMRAKTSAPEPGVETAAKAPSGPQEQTAEPAFGAGRDEFASEKLTASTSRTAAPTSFSQPQEAEPEPIFEIEHTVAMRLPEQAPDSTGRGLANEQQKAVLRAGAPSSGDQDNRGESAANATGPADAVGSAAAPTSDLKPPQECLQPAKPACETGEAAALVEVMADEAVEQAVELLECELGISSDAEQGAALKEGIKPPPRVSLVDAEITSALLHEVKERSPEEIELEEFTFSFTSEASQPENPDTFCFVEEDPEIQEVPAESLPSCDPSEGAAREHLTTAPQLQHRLPVEPAAGKMSNAAQADAAIAPPAEPEAIEAQLPAKTAVSSAELDLATRPGPQLECMQPAVMPASEQMPAATPPASQAPPAPKQPAVQVPPTDPLPALERTQPPPLPPAAPAVSATPAPTPFAELPAVAPASIGPQSSSFAGRISQALERLTSSITPVPVPPVPAPQTNAADAPANGDAPSGANIADVAKYSESEAPQVLAMPVVEPPMFHAPPPSLELESGYKPMPSNPAPNNNRAPQQMPPVPGAPGSISQTSIPALPPVPGAPGSVCQTSMPALSPAPPLSPAPADAPEAPESDTQPSPEAIAEMLAASSPPHAVTHSLTPSQLIRTQTYYQILGVNKLSSYDEIHDKFWRVIRRVVRTRYASGVKVDDVRELKEVLRAICVAHDVLMDPVTRTDYDLRQLGMRADASAPAVETPADVGTTNATPRTRLMIGELLECANILDPKELQIALDMHKAEPGTMFGTFLVKSGFLNPEELDSALIGQRLISSGKLTVAQFQTAMFRMRDHGTAFFDTLLVEGWLTPSEMLDEVNRQQRSSNAPGTPPPAHVPPKTPVAEPAAAQEPTQPAAGLVPSSEHAAVVAAARNAESDLNAYLKNGEIPEDKKD